MQRRIVRLQFNILSLLLLMAFAALAIPSVEPVSKLFPRRASQGVSFLSSIPTYSQAKKARREALEKANPGYAYASSNLMMMVTPNIVIKEEEEAAAFQTSASQPRPRPIPKNRSKDWLAAGWTVFAVVLVVVSVGRIQRRDYN